MQSFGEIAVYSKSIRLLTENRPSTHLQGRFLPRILFLFYKNGNKFSGRNHLWFSSETLGHADVALGAYMNDWRGLRCTAMYLGPR